MRPLFLIDKPTLNRLYWMEELSTRAIAMMYGVHDRSVGYRLRQYGIPLRPPGVTARPVSACVECGRPVCRIKRWRKGGYIWRPTNRCAMHFHARRRVWDRAYMRRKRQVTAAKYRIRRAAPLGRLALIAPEDRVQ